MQLFFWSWKNFDWRKKKNTKYFVKLAEKRNSAELRGFFSIRKANKLLYEIFKKTHRDCERKWIKKNRIAFLAAHARFDEDVYYQNYANHTTHAISLIYTISFTQLKEKRVCLSVCLCSGERECERVIEITIERKTEMLLHESHIILSLPVSNWVFVMCIHFTGDKKLSKLKNIGATLIT